MSPLGPAAGQGRPKDCSTSSSDPIMEGPCADSVEKHEPASDADAAVVESLKALDPNVWTRRALQGKIVRLESVVSHQCIRPRIGADAPGHHGNPRTPELITGHASKGYLGSSVLGCAGKDHLSIYSLLSQNLGGKVKGAFTSGLSLL